MATPSTPPPDAFAQSPASLSSNSPYVQGVAVTPSDTGQLPWVSRALWVGGAGNIVIDLFDAAGNKTNVTFTGVPAGTLLQVRAGAVLATNTTATNIVALR